jgi:hypothetical protein
LYCFVFLCFPTVSCVSVLVLFIVLHMPAIKPTPGP